MPDVNDQTPTTPGQLLAAPSNMPLNSRQAPSLPGPQAPQQQQQPAPTAQQIVAAGHHDMRRCSFRIYKYRYENNRRTQMVRLSSHKL